jgi:hypothetical protein
MLNLMSTPDNTFMARVPIALQLQSPPNGNKVSMSQKIIAGGTFHSGSQLYRIAKWKEMWSEKLERQAGAELWQAQ